MKKFVIAIILVVMVVSLAFSQAKPGGIARQASMGGSQAGYGLVLNPFIMNDPALIFVNPAYQADYKDYLWMNISGGRLYSSSSSDNGYGQQNAGVSFGVTDNLTVGTILSYDPTTINSINQTLEPPFMQRYANDIPYVNNVWEVLAAYKMSNLTLGFGFMYGWSNYDYNYDDKYTWTLLYPLRRDTSTTYTGEGEGSSSMMGLRAGAILDLGNGSSVDFSGAVRFNSATDIAKSSPADTGYNMWYRDNGEYSVSATELQLAARGKFKINNKFNFVPYAMFATVSGEPKEDKAVMKTSSETRFLNAFPRTFSMEESGTAFAFGLGGEYKTQSFYFAGGVSFQSGSVEMKMDTTGSYIDYYYFPADTVTRSFSGTETYTYTALPVINLGAEWWATDWLACRLGYQRAIGSVKHEFEAKWTRTDRQGTSLTQSETYKYENNQSIAHSMMLVGGLNPSTFDGLVTMGVGFKFGGFSLDATVSEEALRRGLGLFGSNDNLNTFGFMTASYNFAE
ncbi:MAG: hypothetical protein HZB59_06670 [Ignavibacteriales bacterium]|nr:hypothetical protein [Ignavibacteriales bacterium]